VPDRDPEEGGAQPLPRWYAALLRAGLAALLGLTLTGLPLAMLGWYRPLAAVPLAAAAAVALWRLWPAPEAGPAGRSPHLAAAAVVALAAVTGLAGARWSGQYLLATRDPGVYALTGMWLGEEGDLRIPGVEEPFAGEPGVQAAGQGFHDSGQGYLYAQGYHLLPVVLAAGSWLGGTALLLKVNAAIGAAVLLVVYAFASRLMRPWLAAAATAALGLDLAQSVFTRDPYSEPLSQLLLFGGLWALWEGRADRSVRLGAAGGLLVGATAMVRVDAAFVLIGVAAALAVDVVLDPRSSRRWAAAVAGAAAVPTVLGLVDGLNFSRVYVDFLWDDVRSLLLALAAVAAGTAVALALRRPVAGPARRLLGARRALAVAAVVVVAAAGAWGWWVRPGAETPRRAEASRIDALYESLQARDGAEVDPRRTYAEDSLPRLALYLGPVALAAGLAGAALAVGRQVRDGGRRWLPFLGVLATSAAYLWSPRIVADQPWAIRRFVVVAIPGLLVLAMWLGDRAADRGRAGGVAAAALAAVAVGFAAWTSAPLLDVRTQVPLLAAVDHVCDTLPPHAAVLLLDDGPLAVTAPQTLRFACDVPVAWTTVAGGPAPVAALVEAAAAQGFEPVVLADTPAPFGPEDGVPVVDQGYEVVKLTIEDRPSEEEAARFSVYRVDVAGATGNR
jgi:hypothetical protein